LHFTVEEHWVQPNQEMVCACICKTGMIPTHISEIHKNEKKIDRYMPIVPTNVFSKAKAGSTTDSFKKSKQNYMESITNKR